MQSDKEDTDLRWSKALTDEIMDVPVAMSAKLLDVELSLRQLMELKAGDIIPIEMPPHLTVFVEELPTYRAHLGRRRDNVALKIVEKIKRPASVKSELQMVTRGGVRIDGEASLEQIEKSI